MIRVVMITRSTLYSVPGGDTVQITETAKNLRITGVEVDIKKTDEKIEYSQYHLLHFFNITRPADILYHMNKSRLPFVITPILIDYSEFDRFHRKGFTGFVFRFFSTDAVEYVKTIGRWLFRKDKLVSKSYLWKGQRASICEILNKAALVLPNSESELARLANYVSNKHYHIVRNGVDISIFTPDTMIDRDPQLVVCAARIEGIKNQLQLVKALTGTRFQLLLIGAPAPNQLSYYKSCRKIAGANIRFLNRVSQQELVSYYRMAKVHILPSWFETTGLSSLEAAVMGCNVVISEKGDAKEYFGDAAVYCSPSSTESILQAVEKAAALPGNELLPKKILDNYTWQGAAIDTAFAYKSITGNV